LSKTPFVCYVFLSRDLVTVQYGPYQNGVWSSRTQVNSYRVSLNMANHRKSSLKHRKSA